MQGLSEQKFEIKKKVKTRRFIWMSQYELTGAHTNGKM